MIKVKEITITPEILETISKIERFNGAWSYMIKGKDSLLTILRAQTKLASTAASNRIEGGLLKDYEVEMVLGGIFSPLYRKNDINEARGYALVLDRITQNHENMVLSENLVKEFHSTLIADREKDEYRKTERPVQNILNDEPLLENASAQSAPKLLQELIDSTNQTTRQGYHPLLISAAFMANFIAINPFGEGNGRLARLITTLLLIKSGYLFIDCFPFETIIEESRKSYMMALKKSQSKEEENHWIMYFLKVIEKATIRLEYRVVKDNQIYQDDRYTNLSPIEKDIVRTISDRGSVYTTELVTILEHHKRPTLKKALKDLVDKHYLEMKGIGRGTYYEIIK